MTAHKHVNAVLDPGTDAECIRRADWIFAWIVAILALILVLMAAGVGYVIWGSGGGL